MFKVNLNQILSKSDDNWIWKDCGNFPDPNPSSILPAGGVGHQAFGKRKSKPKSKSKHSRKKSKSTHSQKNKKTKKNKNKNKNKKMRSH